MNKNNKNNINVPHIMIDVIDDAYCFEHYVFMKYSKIENKL